MGNSTSKVSARAEPYLQRTSQSEAENEMWEWNFGECMCDTNEPRNVASKTGRNTVWKLVSRVSSNSASSDSSSSQSDARNLHTGTTLRPLRLIQSPSTTKVTAADRGEPLSASPLQSQPDIPLHRIDQPLFKRIPLQSNLPCIPEVIFSAAYKNYDPEAAKKHENKLKASLEAQQLVLEENLRKLKVSHSVHDFSLLLLSPFQR